MGEQVAVLYRVVTAGLVEKVRLDQDFEGVRESNKQTSERRKVDLL